MVVRTKNDALIRKPSEDNLTIWGSPSGTLKSQWGEITYFEWCSLEMERMRSRGDNSVYLRTALDGDIAIASLDI